MGFYNAIRICGFLRYFSIRNFGMNSPWYYTFFVISVIVCIVVPYLLGGLNFAIIISKKKFGVDVRDFGSGNAGMTNMRRTFGKKAGLITLAGDAGKSFASCLLGYLLLGRLGCYIAGLFCMLGHMFPIKYKFKGGKGVVCTAVAILMTDFGDPTMFFIPIVFLIILACFFVIVLGTKYVSLGSIMCMLVYPLFLNSFEQYKLKSIDSELLRTDPVAMTYLSDFMFYMIIAFIMTVMVVFMHRGNIKRLWHGEESKFELHTKGKKTLYEEKTEEAENTEPAGPLAGKPNPNTSKKKNRK